MTKEQMINHLRMMRSGVKRAIKYIENLKELSEEDKEDIEIYKDQLEAFNMAMELLEQQPSEDCVSRKELLKLYGNRAFELQKTHQTDKQLGINWCINTLNELPPVTPTHGTCKNCKHWKDSDGVYRRGIGAESKCPINNSRVFEGTFYCADFERRE